MAYLSNTIANKAPFLWYAPDTDMSRKHKETSCTKCRFFQSQEVVQECPPKTSTQPPWCSYSQGGDRVACQWWGWDCWLSGTAASPAVSSQKQDDDIYQIKGIIWFNMDVPQTDFSTTLSLEWHRKNEIPQSPAPLRRRIESGSPRLSQHLESQTYEDHAAQGHTRWAAHHGPHTMPRYARQEA